MPFIKIKSYSVDGGAPKRFTVENLTADAGIAPNEFADSPEAATASNSTIVVSNLNTENSTKDITGTVDAPARTEQAEIEVREAPSGAWAFACHVSDEGAFMATIPEVANKYRVRTINFLGDVLNASTGEELDI
jgi:hypothetical protein